MADKAEYEEKDPALDSEKPGSPPSNLEAAETTNERALLRKLDLKLLPALTILYLLSFLDRSNVANARIEGLTTGAYNNCHGLLRHKVLTPSPSNQIST